MAAAEATAVGIRARKSRWCVICNRELITCKRYSTLSTLAKKSPLFPAQLSDIVDDAVVHSNTTFMCDGCFTKVVNVQKSNDKRNEIKQSYQKTKATRLGSSDLPPAQTPQASPQKLLDRQKRKAVGSPGTPTTRKVSKSIS